METGIGSTCTWGPCASSMLQEMDKCKDGDFEYLMESFMLLEKNTLADFASL